MAARRLERAGIVVLVLALVVLPTAVHGWPVTVAGNVFTAALFAAGLTLLCWRDHPRAVALLGGALLMVSALLADGRWFPDSALVVMALIATVTAFGWRGRQAWVAGAGLAAYLIGLLIVLGESPIPLLMFSVPGFLAGTVLRLRREAAEELAQRGRELEEERELFADLTMRHERARIAAELHDIVGHAISVMIIQAAAGQRLVGTDPARAEQAFAAIAESGRQGRDDLRRLVDLLGGGDVTGPDLSLIEEVVQRATRSGLDVTCRFEGDHGGVTEPAAHMAFRVVQESLTNALRHSPGAAVRVRVSRAGPDLTVSVENDRPTRDGPGVPGTGRGLSGLRERVQEQGGRVAAGPTAHGGWQVEAVLPGAAPRSSGQKKG